MSSESGGSTKEYSNSETVERQIRKAITYSDEKLLKTALFYTFYPQNPT